jgi:hypothetical protein
MTTTNKKAEESEDNGIVPTENNSKAEKSHLSFPELPDDMPPQVKQTIRMAMMSSSMGRAGQHPLFEKFTEDHVHK